MRIVNIHMTGKENFKMRNRIIQVRHYSRKMMIMMLTGAICFSSCFCETAFAKTSKVRVYDVEKGTTSFTSFTYSDNKNDESLAPSEGAEAISNKVRVYDVEKGTTSFTSFTYSDNKNDESLAPSEGAEAISSASQKVVIFHQADGSTIIRKADSNGKVTLPAIRNQTGYTFLGWSTKPDQTQNPQYQAGQVIQVRKKTHLYAVMYNWQQEPDIQVNNLAAQLSEYSGIIFVGDSRTYFMQKTLLREYGKDAVAKVSFVCKTGEGLSWFETAGERVMRSEIARLQSDSDKPVAVIFNLGVNDLSSHNSGNGVDYKGEANAYLARMNTLAEELESDCRLFYMSVNPVNTAMKPTRKEAQLRYFNDRLQSRLNKRFQWIDTYKYLMKNGYSTYNEFKGNIDDGVHYSTCTYKRIYKYCMNAIR